MNRAEAIERLVDLRAQFQAALFTREAIDMAIEALSEETSTIQEKHQLSEEIPTNTPTDAPTDARRNERGMTYTKAEPIKRYCNSKQMMCGLANELGYCKITACVNPSYFQRAYTSNRTNYKGGEDDE